MKHITALAALAAAALFCATDLTAQRTVTTLDKGWDVRPVSTRGGDNSPRDTVDVPHTWNASYLPGTATYNRETMVYHKAIEITPEMAAGRLFLYFEGVNSVADVFVNRKHVACHKGGYSAFSFEVTDKMKAGRNDIELWVSNAWRSDVPPLTGDFNIYGGIHRPCHLIATDKDCISPVFYASPGVLVHQDKVSKESAELRVETIISAGGDGPLTLRTTLLDPEGVQVASLQSPVQDSVVSQNFKVENPSLWNGRKGAPMYKVVAELLRDGKVVDKVEQRTGLRFFSVDKEKGFFLNGEPYTLCGFGRHEDFAGVGSALLPEHFKRDYELIDEVGATALRFAHYQHSQRDYNMSDEHGIVVWTEIPFVGPGGYSFTGFIENPDFKATARQNALELVYQNINHPCVCIWGIFNEVRADEKAYDDPVPFMKELDAIYKTTDPSRLTSFAIFTQASDYYSVGDLIGVNKYNGWDGGRDGQFGQYFDSILNDPEAQPVGVAEYGIGGSVKQHGPKKLFNGPLCGAYHSEEDQCRVHEGFYDQISSRPYLWCRLVWNFADFQSALREEGDAPGKNDKGMVTYDRSVKKDVFYFYKAQWNPEPMVYITQRRYTERPEAKADVRVYTNMDKATLYLNGEKVGSVKPDHLNRACWEGVELKQGENVVRVVGIKGKSRMEDTCTWTVK